MGKEWNVLSERDGSDLRAAFPSRLVRQILTNRGIQDAADAQSFLHPDYGRDLHDPFLFNDMERAAARVIKALTAREHIAIHGDYDADGVCASAIIASTLEFLGAQPYVHLPHRMKDGYGLKRGAVEAIAVQGSTLLITADCGISNLDAIGYAATKGIDTIIVDHHHVPHDLPLAYAIIHCDREGERYPFRHLSAGGVAFKFAQGILRTARLTDLKLTERNVEAFEKWLLDLVAISTVADVMPLMGENRVLVTYGLRVLGRTKRMGLRTLMARAGLGARLFSEEGLSVRNIAFQLAPRINAAGRIEHASLAYDLLQATNEEKGIHLAELLETANIQRQRITETLLNESEEQIAPTTAASVLVAYGREWSVGLVGLVAGKLVSRFNKPAFVIGTMNGLWTGSCRSDGVFNCMDALGTVSDMLDHWGGHAQAAGFTLKEGIDPMVFADALRLQHAGYIHIPPRLQIDAAARFTELDDSFVSLLALLSPYGEGNPSPLLITRNVEVMNASIVGKGEQHLKCVVKDTEGVIRNAIAFDYAAFEEQCLRVGARVDIVYEPVLNKWNGDTSLELYVRDSRYAE